MLSIGWASSHSSTINSIDWGNMWHKSSKASYFTFWYSMANKFTPRIFLLFLLTLIQIHHACSKQRKAILLSHVILLFFGFYASLVHIYRIFSKIEMSFFINLFHIFLQTYIVYMGDRPKGIDPTTLPSLHSTMAQNVLGRFKLLCFFPNAWF